ncbi:hypothetical protein MCOR23_009306 [Pyricularia oryzae]|nr:hypothetical protein MCOR23_009306 [Pyricularia oryzae]
MATQTPMREVPGAFLATPAIAARNDRVSRQLFDTSRPSAGSRTSSSTALGVRMSSPRAGAMTSVTSGQGTDAAAPLPPLLKAAKSVKGVLQQDESYPDLDSVCRPGATSDYDLQFADSPLAPFQRAQMYPIPDRIFETLNMSNLTTKLGLFAEIGYAYACIDNALLMWNFSQPNPEIIGFEDQPHSIQTVALVPPKPGVFLSSITHILVVATSQDLILLGIAASSSPNGLKTIELYSTKMALGTPSSHVSHIVGTSAGRIFFGSSDETDIYELCYQQEEKWFSGRCSRINHSQPGWSSAMPRLPASLDIWSPQKNEFLIDMKVDNSRNLLYTLSNKSTIRTYHIETPDRLTCVITKEKNHCLRDVTHWNHPSPLLTDAMAIVAISPIPATEASKLHLMALTSTGCRLFLSATSSASYMINTSSSLAPQSMQVQFVKFPPKDLNRDRRNTGYDSSGDSLTDLQSRSLEVSELGFRFPPGYFIDFVRKPGTPDTTTIFASAPETGRIKAIGAASALKFYEHANWIDIGPKTVALDVGLINKPFAAAKQPLGFGNELAVQFDEDPCEFAILTNSGIYLVRRRRFVDIFANTMRVTVGEESLDKDIRKFIQLYGRVETVSAALAVACGQGTDLRTGTSRVMDQGTADRAKSVFVNFGGQPLLAESDGAISPESVKLSSRHDALALYLTRLIRSLWKAKVITARVDANAVGGVVVSSTISTAKLTIVQENIERLRNFLNTNKGIIQGLSGPADLQRVSSRQEEVALQAEHQALHALQKLMESISEGISFVLMLFDERVTDIFLRLESNTRDELKELTYESLFSQPAGKDLAKLLVKAIVNRNIESGSNVETVADALRRRCGSFCSPDDVIIFKAQEQLKRASEQTLNHSSQRTLLSESLRLFERVAGNLTYANLRSAAEQYTDLKYYAGAIRLCLVVAKEKDRGNAALAWINENKPANDPREKIHTERQRCYDLVHAVLERLDAESSKEPELVDGKPSLAATKRMEAYSVVNDSDDEVFHFGLYAWYVEQNWTDRILAIDSPHVITFLKRLAGSDVRHAELLCRFYTHRGQFYDAAQVQAELANSEFDIGIKDRITLLSRAKGNASVMGARGNRQQQQLLSHEISELLEIAHIQDDLLERLKADPRIADERKMEIEKVLDGQIQGLTELFNTYADPACYYDLCLLVYHAADYHNTRLIADTWKNLIDATHREILERHEAYNEYENSGGRLPPGVTVPPSPPPLPYEAVSMQIQNIAHRTSLDTMIFPIDTLLPIVCEYAVAESQDESIGADNSWPVLLFLQLQVSQSVIVKILERIFDAQEAPFTGRKKRIVAEWINAAVESWLREVERQGSGKQDGALSSWVFELLGRVDEEMLQLAGSVRDSSVKQSAEKVGFRARQLRNTVDRAMRSTNVTGSMRYL